VERNAQVISLEIWTNGSIHPRQALYNSLKILMNLFSQLEKVKILNSVLSKNIIKSNENYNKMFQKAVNDIQIFLAEDEKFFDNKLAVIKIKCENSIMFSRLDDINERIFGDKLTFSYKKLYYILFCYLAITRNLINIIQNNGKLIWLYYFFNFKRIKSNPVFQYGLVNVFEPMDKKIHPLDMKRFYNYKIRLIYNYLKYKDISNTRFDEITFYIKNIEEEIVYITCTFKFINGTYSFNHNQHISNNYERFGYKINTLILIIKHFDNLQIEDRSISDKKRDIIGIYYYIIILMPFSLGTASIAEMFLYSLWKFYIKTRLEIKQTIMLDVEALSHTFDDFYRNCFTHDEKENDPAILSQIEGYNEVTYIPVIYTPYLVESKLNNKSSNFGSLFSMD
jgi:hypothetical protein